MEEPRPEAPRPRSFFHPWSGVTILAVDWLAFGTEAPAGLVAEPLICLAAFCLTFWAVARIQRHEAGDSDRAACFKALLGAVAAGLPFPVTGTILGTAILVLSGLPMGKTPVKR